MKDFYKVSEVAEMFNITTNKIRFYEEKGLIAPLRNEESGYRQFKYEDIIKLQSILLYRTIGFSIEDIKDILENKNNESFLDHFTKQWTIVNDEIHKLNDIRISIGKILDSVYEGTCREANDDIFKIIEGTKELSELRNGWRDKWNFNNWAESYDEDVKTDITKLKMYKDYEYVLNRVFELGKSKGRILDIGVGTGNLSGRFLNENYDISAIDQSREMLRKSKEKYADLKVRIGEFLKIPFEDRSFNTIVSTYAFHHLDNEEKSLAIKEMIRVLKDDGKIVLGDLMFRNAEDRENILSRLKDDEIREVEGEYFSNIDFLEEEAEKNGGKLEYEKVDDITYIVVISL